MNKGQSYSISFAVMTSDGACIEPDESKTITCPVGTKITVQTRDISPGCNGGLSYFKYGQLSSWAVSFSPDMYATVENGWHMVSAKAVITTPEATSYIHEYYVNVCGVLSSVDKKDPVYDDAIDFFLQEEPDDDTHPDRTHRLKEGVPLVLKSGTQFKVYARTLVYGSEVYVSRFEYNKQQRSIGECTVADGEHQLTVYGYRRLAAACGDVIYTKRAFTIFGQPPAASLSEEKSTKMTDTKEGSSYNLFVETCDDDPVCYPVGDDGRVEVPAGTRFRFVATSNDDNAKVSVTSWHYREKLGFWLHGSVYSTVARETRVALLHLCVKMSACVQVHVTIIPILNDRSGAAAPVADVEVTPPLGKDVERERDGVMSLATAKETHETTPAVQEGSSPAYDLFVGLCDSAPTPYKAVKDGRIEVPAGTHIRFAARSNLEGYYAHVQSFKYQGRGMRSRAHCESANVVDYAQTATVHVILTKIIDKSVTRRESTTIAIIPAVEAASFLGKDVEYDGIILTTTEPAKKTHSVPVCADAEGTYGKRFIPPWNDKERACEECFLTRVVDPRGWKATTGSGACKYTPMRVWLERADDDDMPFAENDQGEYLVPYGTRVVAKTDRGMIDQVQAGGVSHYDRPFTFSPIVQCPSWNVYVKVVFGGLASSCLFTFRLRPAEPDEELKVIWEQNRVQDAIRNTTQTLNDARESLEKTWEKIQAAQDKLTELKVEQAKLTQTK
jgi:hypothetical protein